MTSHAPSIQLGSKVPASQRRSPDFAHTASSGVKSGAPTWMSAPVERSTRTLRSATEPPPTTSTFRPCSCRKTGYIEFGTVIQATIVFRRLSFYARLLLQCDKDFPYI